MRFSESEIDTAMHMRAAGLSWGPEPGHYVFDINGIVRAGSPFQAGVFLIHSANTFEILAGGQDELSLNRMKPSSVPRHPESSATEACVGANPHE